ncbi:MAG: hypothetical protein NTU44_19445 [Bacteroidetes bacterium]|nr:hypothetical protein [Bacteroidota bacterium]
MKTKNLFMILLLVSAGFFTGCQKDSLLSTNFEVVLYQDFVVTSVNDTLFARDTVLDASAQSTDIEKYKDNIQEVSLTKVAYFLTNFSGDTTQKLLEGHVAVANEDGTNTTSLTSMNNVVLKSLLNNETILTIDPTGATNLGTLVLNAPHRFKVSAFGRTDKKPLDFTIRIKFYLKIKAKVI